jgi:hypothetical protein
MSNSADEAQIHFTEDDVKRATKKPDPSRVVKQVEELLTMGGKFFAIDGESYCDTALHSWKLEPGIGFVRLDD